MSARRGKVAQRGKVIRIEGEGYEFRAEDVEWANLHRAKLERTRRGVKLTFLTVESALVAYDEIMDMGAANIDTLEDVEFTTDVLTGLVERLVGG